MQHPSLSPSRSVTNRPPAAAVCHTGSALEFARSMRVAGYRFNLEQVTQELLRCGRVCVEDAFGQQVSLQMDVMQLAESDFGISL